MCPFVVRDGGLSAANAPGAGERFPDLKLPDHAGHGRSLSALAGGDPTVLHFYRGWWCPKEQAFLRRLVAFQDEVEVAYANVVSVSVDAPEVNAAFRAGLGARWTFLSDEQRRHTDALGLRETTDTTNDPYLPDARRVDRRVLDPDGEAGVLSLVLPDEHRLVAFDDPAVQHARRRVLAETPADALTTLLIDDRRFAGALTVRRGPDAERLLRDDPFARIAPASLLTLGPGLIGRVPAPTGPTIERHGSAQPWPWDRFPTPTS